MVAGEYRPHRMCRRERTREDLSRNGGAHRRPWSINPDYLEQTRVRHAHRLRELELIRADIQSDSVRYEPVALTYAALLFEYVDVPSALKTLKRNSCPNAVLTTVLQLPHATLGAVSQSPYTSLGTLASAITLVSPGVLCHAAEKAGFAVADSTTIELMSGKKFCVQNFKGDFRLLRFWREFVPPLASRQPEKGKERHSGHGFRKKSSTTRMNSSGSSTKGKCPRLSNMTNCALGA